MTYVRIAAIATLGFVLGCQPVVGQTPFTYRDHALGSSLASVIRISGARAAETRTFHEQPARIEELKWRAPHMLAGKEPADPVRDVLFRFYDGQLFQVVVTYDRDRMEGLTNDDVVEALSATYGVPLLAYRRAPGGDSPADVPADTVVVARWEDAASLLTLTRDTLWPQFRLILASKTLNAHAQTAIEEGRRLDAAEAPQRDVAQRKQATADANAATVKARVVNKAAFKP